MSQPIDAADIARRLRAALAEADAFIRSMPAGQEGLIFLDGDAPVQPDVTRLATYQALPGRRHGIWPGSSEIGASMLGR